MPFPTVDVVVPCYRYGAELPLAVGSVLDQRGVAVRVLVIDDASRDGSADVARALAAVDSRVEVREHEDNHGHIATFNEGLLDWAKADYCVLMSADDALTPGALARATTVLEADPRIGMVYGRPIVWDGAMPLAPARTMSSGVTVHAGHDWLRARFARGDNSIWSPEVVARTTVQQRIGGYDPRLLHTSDLEMWLRFALHSDIAHLPAVDQAYYRSHGANMSVAYRADSGVRDLAMRLLAFRTLLARPEVPALLPDAAALATRVSRRIARDALAAACDAHARGLPDQAAELVAFSRETVGDIGRLPEWHVYRLRSRFGPLPTAGPVGSRLRTVPLQRARRRLRDRRRRVAGL